MTQIQQEMIMMSEMYKRSYDFEMRAEKTERGQEIVGRPIVYESKTDIGGIFAEIIDKGALDKTDLTDVRFMVNHDLTKIPLARSRKNTKNSTMRLTVDDEGLSIRVVLDTDNNTDARSLYSAIERGDITGMSFMFGVRGEKWEDLDSDHPTRHITDISTVVEVSAVTFPAYDETSIGVAASRNAVTSEDISALDNARIAVETARRSSVDTELELAKAKNHIYAIN